MSVGVVALQFNGPAEFSDGGVVLFVAVKVCPEVAVGLSVVRFEFDRYAIVKDRGVVSTLLPQGITEVVMGFRKSPPTDKRLLESHHSVLNTFSFGFGAHCRFAKATLPFKSYRQIVQSVRIAPLGRQILVKLYNVVVFSASDPGSGRRFGHCLDPTRKCDNIIKLYENLSSQGGKIC